MLDMLNVITSRNNENIKWAVKLRSDKEERRKTNMFFLEGVRLCSDAAMTDILIVAVFVTERAKEKYSNEMNILLAKAEKQFLVTEEIADKLSDTKSPQGVFCICKTLDKECNIDKIKYNGFYVALEDVQTPGNLGAIARTAEALGIDGLIINGGCDVTNPKAQRAAMGSLLRLPVFEIDDLPDFLIKCRDKGMKAYAAVPDGDAVPVTLMDKCSGVIVVIGNEGNGLSNKTVSSCDSGITIPMSGRAESLNAGAAACIVMWEMVR